MPTDEELAMVIHQRAGRAVPWSETTSAERAFYLELAREVREALAPPVKPLKPSEMIRIPDAYFGAHDGVEIASAVSSRTGERWLEVAVDSAGELSPARLDADGVRQLRAACDRWLAAQEDQ